ncbi:MAG TPA: hypothetical protein VLJ21_05235 [Candidatus Binatia bacterium]|nr:hypothetical protein [Candidatus Binatia bacterium]
MEILGLAIIVVLIMLGVLFAILFVLRAPASQTERQFKESQLASSMVTAMLGTTSACRDATVTELLQDCAIFSRIDCGGRTSCETVHDAFEQMLTGTLGAWKRSYTFSVTGTDKVKDIHFESGDCSGEIEASTNPVPTAGLPLQVTLQLCS